jgi:hypothetical protein
MDYFAGRDISMDETHVCVLHREGVVVHESKTGLILLKRWGTPCQAGWKIQTPERNVPAATS